MANGWTSADEPVLAGATRLARELADPIRLTVLQLLAHEGPHGMTQLADILNVTPARLGNHLAKLRAAGLIDSEPAGRHVTYRLTEPRLATVLDALANYAGGTLPIPTATDQPERLCYDHAAGRLGVALLDQLLAEHALRPRGTDSDQLDLGLAGPDVLARFHLDPADFTGGRRKLATRCLDRTLRRPHLGGALGAAILSQLRAHGLVQTANDGRTLTIPPDSAEQLRYLIRPCIRPTPSYSQL